MTEDDQPIEKRLMGRPTLYDPATGTMMTSPDFIPQHVESAWSNKPSTDNQQVEFEKVARAQTLAVIAAKNGNYSLACKAQTQAVDVLSKVRTKGKDVKGYADDGRESVCAS